MTDTPINRRAGAHVQIWAFIVALAIASIGSRVLALSGQSAPHPDGVTVPWWALAAAFAVGESFALHIHFRSNSGSFSLHEIPLVVGLIYTDPADLWLAVLLGTAIGLTLSRRQPAMKLAFNVSNVSLRVVVAWAMFQWIVGSADPLSRSGWAAIALAVVASSILEVAMMLTAVAITERDIRGQRFMGVFAFGVATGLTTAVQAMIALIVLRADAAGIVLIGCSTLVLWAAYRAYGNERATRERIEFLHQSTRSLRNNSATADAVGVLLDEAVEMFRARRAEFFLFPGVDSDEPPAYFERDREISSVRALDEKEASRGAALAAAIATPVLATPRQCPNDLIADHLAAHDIEDAMFGVLRSDERSLGVLIVANRLGTISTFDTEDLRLFESLIDHASVALENDRLGQALSDLRSVEQVLAHQAQYDSLTGLANRALFTERLAAALADEEPIAVLFVDLDDFKLVNDTLGHATGDRLLVEVAERLEAVTRSDDLAARLGGDEFALLIGSAIDPLEVANRLIGALSTQFLFGTNEVRIGASVGVARSTHADGSASAILQQADLAMYAAKDRGKGSVVEYSDELQDEALGKQRLQTSLRRAITEEQFDVHYQPIVRLHDQHIVGAEALVRWREDSGRLLKPEVFIMEAERTGLLTSIDRQVREMVLTGLGELTIAAGGAFFASLNVSPQQLHDGDFVPNLVRDIGAARVSPESLVLEITESSFIRDTDEASAKLERVRALGIRFALDDFGTGYSALSVVRRLPLDILKVAQPFVADLSDEKNRAFVEAIMKLSHTMGLTVVAEGVETESALEALRDLECDLAQGYLFARPMPHAQLVRAITAQQSDLIAPSIETAT